jgi:deoxyxylulose-5-phosphate synthase
MAPSNVSELEQMLKIGISLDSPSAIRYPKDLIDNSDSEPVKLGKCSIESDGKDILMIYVGSLRAQILGAEKLLLANGLHCQIVNLRFIEPLDIETLKSTSQGKRKVVCVEDGVCDGGVGQKIESQLNMPILKIGIKKQFPPIGTRQELFEWAGLDSQSIANQVIKSLSR